MGFQMDQATTFTAPQPIKLTVDNFNVLHAAGAFENHRHAELIDGVIVDMSPIGRTHGMLTSRLFMRLAKALESTNSPLEAFTTATLAIPPHDAPELDLFIAAKDESEEPYFAGRMAALVIEIARTTLAYDLSSKRKLYARADIPEYWVVDADKATVHQFWSPLKDQYRESRLVQLQGPIASATISDLAIDGSGIL